MKERIRGLLEGGSVLNRVVYNTAAQLWRTLFVNIELSQKSKQTLTHFEASPGSAFVLSSVASRVLLVYHSHLYIPSRPSLAVLLWIHLLFSSVSSVSEGPRFSRPCKPRQHLRSVKLTSRQQRWRAWWAWRMYVASYSHWSLYGSWHDLVAAKLCFYSYSKLFPQSGCRWHDICKGLKSA